LSPRPRVTFDKRRKEQARQEKQRAKAQRKLQRKFDKQTAATDPESSETRPENEAVIEPQTDSENTVIKQS